MAKYLSLKVLIIKFNIAILPYGNGKVFKLILYL